jgi:hypothetical protein
MNSQAVRPTPTPRPRLPSPLPTKPEVTSTAHFRQCSLDDFGQDYDDDLVPML